MGGALLLDGREARADFDALHRVDAHHRVRDVGVEPVEDRLAPTDRHVRGNHVDGVRESRGLCCWLSKNDCSLISRIHWHCKRAKRATAPHDRSPHRD